jgi:hypothetical protein
MAAREAARSSDADADLMVGRGILSRRTRVAKDLLQRMMDALLGLIK